MFEAVISVYLTSRALNNLQANDALNSRPQTRTNQKPMQLMDVAKLSFVTAFSSANYCQFATATMQLKSIFEPRCEKNRSSEFLTRSDTNRAVLPQKIARGLKFRIKVVEGLFYTCSENKGADQLCGAVTVTAKLICVFVFAFAKIRFSHDEAHF